MNWSVKGGRTRTMYCRTPAGSACRCDRRRVRSRQWPSCDCPTTWLGSSERSVDRRQKFQPERKRRANEQDTLPVLQPDSHLLLSRDRRQSWRSRAGAVELTADAERTEIGEEAHGSPGRLRRRG